MNSEEARDLVAEVAASWVADPGSDVVWSGEYQGRHGVRVAQQVRDFTTVWFDVGDRTLGYEAYVAPAPPYNREEVYRQCLLRNAAGWRVRFAVDAEGALFLRGRIPLDDLSSADLDAILGAIYDMVEVSFRGIIRSGFVREKSS